MERKLLFLLVILLLSGELSAQVTVVQGAAMNMTAEQLVRSQIVGQGIIISNASFNGSKLLITSNQIGTFTSMQEAQTQLGIHQGIIFTSGTASGAIGPNMSTGFSGNIPALPGDPDLNIIAGVNTNDASIIEFDFIPMSDTLTFKYVFGSEEFLEYCRQFNDAFGFFLSGPGITGPFSNEAINIAIMPMSTQYVTINNICPDTIHAWNNCEDADPHNCTPPLGAYYQYDVITHVFTATAVVQPCLVYHIKLAVADAKDHALDSGVFLEKNSFSATNLEIHTDYALGLSTVEGCTGATVSFKLAEPPYEDDTIYYTLSGTALNGIDFPAIPSGYIIVSAGQDSVSFHIDPYEDGIPEGTEFIRFEVPIPTCQGIGILIDTVFISDNTPLNAVTSQDTSACVGTEITLFAQGTGSQAPYRYNWSTGDQTPTTTFTTLPGINRYRVRVLDTCGYFVNDSIFVTGKPLPVVTTDPVLYGVCSGKTTNIPLVSAPSGSTFTWTAQCVNPGISGYSAGSGSVISQTLVNLSPDYDSVKYLISAVNNGCTGPPQSVKVGVAPALITTATPAMQSICSGGACNIAVSCPLTSTTFTWTYRYSSSFLSGASAGSGSSINQILVNSGITDDTVIYVIVPHRDVCDGDTTFVRVIVMAPPLPVISGPASVCKGILSSYSTQTGMNNYSWTTEPDGVIVSGAGTNTVVVQWNAPGNKNVKVTFLNALGCGPTGPASFNVTVHPLPVVTITGPATVCQNSSGNIYITASGMSDYTWLISEGGTISSGGTSVDASVQITWSTPGAQTVSVNYTDGNGCTATSPVIFPVIVLPEPSPTISGVSSVCEGTVGELYTTESGRTNYLWQITGGIITAGGTTTDNSVTVSWFSAGNGLISLKYTDANGCTMSSPYSYPVTVKPLPAVMSTPSSPVICSSQSTGIALNSPVPGTTFTWTAAPGGATISGWGPGSGNSISQILIITGNVAETVTYHVVPVASLCQGPASDITVVVNPKPYLTTNPMSQTICSESNTNIILQSNISANYSWTSANTSGNITGHSGGNSSTINQILTNTLPVTGEVQYTISILTALCQNNDTVFHVFVKPKPHVLTANPDTSVCSPAPTAIHLTSDVAGTTFTWTATGSSANVSGFSAGSGNLISQNLVNSGFTDETVTFFITGLANGCDGFLKTYVVTVHPEPDVYFSPVSQSICSGDLTGISILSHTTGSTFSWTASGPWYISGFSPSTGNTIAQLLTNNGTSPGIVTYTVTPVNSGCSGNSMPVPVTVKPVAHVITSPSDLAQCTGTVFIFNLVSDAGGTTFAWTATATNPLISGFSGGAGNVISQTLINEGTDVDSVIFTVTPTANGCTGVPGNYYAIVQPAPALTVTPLNEAFCSGNSTNISMTTDVTGSLFSWTCTASSGNLSGFAPGNAPGLSSVLQQTLVNSGPGNDHVTYHFTVNAGGCTGPPKDVVVTVHPIPVVSFNLCFDQITTDSARSIILNGAVPSGGIFTGPGVTGNTFDPRMAGTGTHTIGYSWSNTWGCNGISNSQTITVLPSVLFQCGNILNDIRDGQTYSTVMIGSKCWMSANLNFGNQIPAATMQRNNCLREKYCHRNSPDSCLAYGGLYQWDEMMDYRDIQGLQGICPPEWHVPSENDWNDLFAVYGGPGFTGTSLKNFSGFNVLFLALRFDNSAWEYHTFATFYWTSTARGPYKAWAHALNTYDPSVSTYPSNRANAFYIRCIKD